MVVCWALIVDGIGSSTKILGAYLEGCKGHLRLKLERSLRPDN